MMKELIEKLKQTLGDNGMSITTFTSISEVIDSLESLQSKGKTKEELKEKFLTMFDDFHETYNKDEIFDWFWNNLRESHANKDGVVVAEKRTDIECPECGEHHVDKDEWSKRLHKKHLCEKCGHVWQPHEGYTFGI